MSTLGESTGEGSRTLRTWLLRPVRMPFRHSGKGSLALLDQLVDDLAEAVPEDNLVVAPLLAREPLVGHPLIDRMVGPDEGQVLRPLRRGLLHQGDQLFRQSSKREPLVL